MDRDQKINQLRGIINSNLLHLIDNDYVLWDLPYYPNIGDVLIWNGTEEFLKASGKKCLGRSSFRTCSFEDLSPNTIILLQGGGNWGDVWHEHHNFRKKVIERYPNNRIIIFPQTVFYKDKNKLIADAKIFGEHKYLTICARDKQSLFLLSSCFKNTLLLVPDMAFFIDLPQYKSSTKKVLLLKRSDKELSQHDSTLVKVLNRERNVDIHDWPTYERNLLIYTILYYGKKFFNLIDKYCHSNICSKWEDLYHYNIVRKYCLSLGVNFLKQYDKVYSTRLHTAILSVIIGKKVYFINNSYGKNKQFYDAWLSDLDLIEFYE